MNKVVIRRANINAGLGMLNIGVYILNGWLPSLCAGIFCLVVAMWLLKEGTTP